MSIYSQPFGGVTLTGEDAAAFLRQIDKPAPDEACEAVKRGVLMVRDRPKDRPNMRQSAYVPFMRHRA